MSSVDEKLRRGFELIARSGGDTDLLGVALLSIHGALEDHLRQALEASAALAAEDRRRLEERSAGWLTVIDLAQTYLGLDAKARQIILEANKPRQAFAHGEPFNGRVSSLLRYARFVEALCDREGLLDQVLIEQPRTRSRASAARAAEEPNWDARDSRYRGRAERTAGLSLQGFVALLAIASLLLLCAWFYTRLDVPRLLQTIGVMEAPTVLPPLPTPLPTPTTRQARIVGLGEGPGWLHETPSFDSGTLPIPLSEGMQVTVLDQQQTDLSGNLWIYVSAGGYEGWCPANNLAFDGP